MLRITVESSEKSTALKLEGRLSGPWVQELTQAWEEAVTRVPANSITVDLEGVRFIDNEGIKLLGRLRGQGADLQTTGLMTKFVLKEVAAE